MARPLLALRGRTGALALQLGAPGAAFIAPGSSPARSSVARCCAARSFSVSTLKREKFRSGPASATSPATIAPQNDSAHEALSKMAFAFDIDGVLYQGKTAVPGAKEALRMLRSQEVRYVFLTNGGCAPEIAKAESLSKRLGMSIDEDVIRNRVILSHTPMSGWDATKKQGTVLITGSHPEIARQVAKAYGFQRVVTPADLLAADESIFPFDGLRESLHKHSEELPDGKKLLRLEDPYDDKLPDNLLKIDQILVWNDPRDWAVDIQVISDLLQSRGGYFGTLSPKNGDKSVPNNGWQQDGQPDVWISNVDLVWKTEYPLNRFGTGAFLHALKGVWSDVTGGAELKYTPLGKPWHHTYKYAHDRLLHYHSDLANVRVSEAVARTGRPLRRVYMIGDNPESDIRGANDFKPEDGTEWVSILVKTGVWKQTALEQNPRYRPTVIVDDVVDAVVWAMRNEGLDVDRAWVMAQGK